MNKAQILVVEDESIVALDLKKRLIRLGYAVPAVAASGVEAIDQTSRIRPDLILMDIRLQGEMDGVEAAETIRRRFDMPIIYLTANADEATVQRARNSKAFGYLLKPFAEKELQTNIEMALYRHQLEQKLKQSEQWLAATLNSIGEAVIATDEQGRIKFMNPVAEALTGWGQADGWGKDLDEIFKTVNSTTRAPRENPVRQVLNTGKVIEPAEPVLLIAKTGSEIFIDDSLAPIRNEQGDITGLVLVFRDITQRRQAEAALAQSHQLYTALSRIQARFIQETNTHARFEEMLRVLLELTGSEYGFIGEILYRADGQPYLETHAMSDNSRDAEARAAFAQQASQRLEFYNVEIFFGAVLTSGQLVIANDPARDPYWGGLPAGSPPLQAFLGIPFHHGEELIGIVGLANRPGGYSQALATWLEPVLSTCTSIIIADRHERHRQRAEHEIRRQNRDLSLLNQVIAASASSMEAQELLKTTCHALGQALDVPSVTATLFNSDKTSATIVAEYLSNGQSSLLDSEISLTSQPFFQRLLTDPTSLLVDDLDREAHPEPMRRGLSLFNTASLLIVPLLVAGEVSGSLNLESPEPGHFSTTDVNLIWSVADQVASALARLRLDKEHRQLSAAIEQTAESVVITDTTGQILYVNPAFEQVTGYDRAEVIGRTPALLNSHKHPRSFYEELWTTIRNGLVWQGRFINKKKDGTLYTEETTITPVRNKKGEIVNYVAVKRDVTRELQLEEQYRQAQKMEAVGLLAGGIAHDFNNILTIINGYTDLMLSQLPPNSPLQEMLSSVLQSGKRAADLVRQLLAFSRSQLIQPRTLELNALVLELHKMLRRVISENIQIETTLAPDLCYIKADPHQLEQIILNLAVNAQDAMPHGGRLIIETANVALNPADVINYPEAEPGEYVLLKVGDTGQGMSESVKARIFEPFFTTKELGQGTGLGLATVYGIVKQNKGHIWVQSEENQGTIFHIFLPRARVTIPLAAQRPDHDENLNRGAETILLVEDEQSVREFIALVLYKQGYNVIEAADGQEALQLAKASSQEIHLLLTDMVMPGMSGTILAQHLSQYHPNLKVLIMTGYTTHLIAYPGRPQVALPFIQKPFSPEALLSKVREALKKVYQPSKELSL